MGIKIRLVGTPDKPVSDKVRQQLDTLDYKCLEYLYPRNDAYWWLAKNEDGKAIGYCGLKPLTGSHKGMGFLCRAGVLPEAQGYNLQRRFIKLRIRKAKQIGLKQVITYTDRYNFKCIANMIKCGLRFYIPKNLYAGNSSVYFNLKID